jgi:transposase
VGLPTKVESLPAGEVGPRQLKQSLHKAAPGSSETAIEREFLALRSWAKQCALVYQPSLAAGLLTEGLLSTWQEEIVLELDVLELEEAQDRRLQEEIQELYKQVHPQGQLHTIPGIGPRVAPCCWPPLATSIVSAAPKPSANGLS